MKKGNFNTDLIFGQSYERLITEQLEILLNVKLDHYNDDGKYDFMMSDLTFYEVKTGRNANKYNSFFVEFECGNKPSGINTTQSDYYILCNTQLFFVMNDELLRNLINNTNFNIRNCNTAYGFIIPIDEIYNITKFIGQVANNQCIRDAV